MALIPHTETFEIGSGTIVSWLNASTADTLVPYRVSGPGGISASWQAVANTAGSASVKMTSSNNGTNYADMPDVLGNTVLLTAGAMTQISVADLYFLPDISGGSGDDWSITVILRA